MKKTRLVILMFVTLFLPSVSVAEDCQSVCQTAQVKAYFSALDQVSMAGSSISDIDKLLSMLHEDVQYIHENYGANFNRKTWRQAFLRNLSRGFYNSDDSKQSRIIRSIEGNNFMAVEYSKGLILGQDDWMADELRLVLFGFTNGKISLVKELW